MLKTHMADVENALLATAKVPANSGHSIHKGTPRESFITTFLKDHLGEHLGIGTGEVIDASSKPGEPRNQFDIVIYRKDYPRLSFGGGINAFLAESVVATISVKSTLSQEEFESDMRAAARLKSLNRSVIKSFSAGYVPPSILSYVVAYDGPARMETVYNWINKLRTEIPYPRLTASVGERNLVSAGAIDAVFVLGKGFVHYGNAPIGFFGDQLIATDPESRWVIGELGRGSLLLLFIFLTVAGSGVSGSWLNPMPYLQGLALQPGKVTIGK